METLATIFVLSLLGIFACWYMDKNPENIKKNEEYEKHWRNKYHV